MATTIDSMLAEVKEDYKKNFGRDATLEDMEKRRQRLEKSFQKHPVSGMIVPEDVARAYTAKELNAMSSSKSSGNTSTGGGGGGAGIPKVGPKKPFEMKSGGVVKSSASKRADGCAIRGKTRS